jgi:hypothetical protein
MALGSTQPLTEMSTRNIRGGKGRPARKTNNLTAISKPIVYKMWEPRRLTNLWASTACYRDNFNLVLSFVISLGDKNTVWPLYMESVREKWRGEYLDLRERSGTIVEKIVE